MKPSAEQQAIIECASPLIKVNAFSGCAKSTTLRMYSQARTRENILYITFSRSVREQASATFPSNVKCVTSHSLAYPKFGSRYAAANKLAQTIRSDQAEHLMDLSTYPEEIRTAVATSCLRMIAQFITSRDHEISTAHLKFAPGGSSLIPDLELIALSKNLWHRMIDLKDLSAPITHDGYLKLYQLSGNTLQFDSVLFDEAQDTNPATAAIFEGFRGNKIIVGDTHQSIFSFRNSINAMEMFENYAQLSLSKSFRFGSDIAQAASAFLQHYKDRNIQIDGNERIHSRVGYLRPGARHTCIARTNTGVFEAAIAAVKEHKRLAFVGGLGGYRMGDMLDAYRIYAGDAEAVKSPNLRRYATFNQLEEASLFNDDYELQVLVSLVKRHGTTLPRYISRVKELTVENELDADIILTTTHRAKGLEWDMVRLADDFTRLFNKDGDELSTSEIVIEEVNLIYVAMTRARLVLQLPTELAKILEVARRKPTPEGANWREGLNLFATKK